MTFPSQLLFPFLLLALLASSALAVPVPITTREYVTFLNAVAAADPERLYDEKMGSQAADCRLQQATDYRLQTTGYRLQDQKLQAFV